jgi:hypothetical protein
MVAYVHGMHLSLLVGAVFIFGGALLSLAYLPARAGDHTSNPTEAVPGDIVVATEDLELATE